MMDRYVIKPVNGSLSRLKIWDNTHQKFITTNDGHDVSGFWLSTVSLPWHELLKYYIIDAENPIKKHLITTIDLCRFLNGLDNENLSYQNNLNEFLMII